MKGTRDNMEKNKKIIIGIICGVIVCIVIALLVTFITKSENNKKNQKQENVIANIKSTRDAKIEENGVEVKNIKVVQEGKQVKVESTLKNNTKKEINELFITIDLYNENDEVELTVSKRVMEKIKNNGEYTFDVYAMLEKKDMKIKSAKINNINVN